KLIFFGKKPETELADAKYDGKINPLDYIQIKLIIVGKEKELTIIDCIERIVTVKKPVNRVVILEPIITEVIKAIGAKDKVVGIYTTSSMWGGEVFFPELSKLPHVGSYRNPDCEAILELEPDIVIQYSTRAPGFEDKLKPAGITVVRVDPGAAVHGNLMAREWKKLGHILDKKDEAKELIDWYEGYLDEIKSRTEGLSDEDKQHVYAAFSFLSGLDMILGKECYLGYACTLAGGFNIAGDVGYGTTVDPEWVIAQNPDFIVLTTPTGEAAGSYEVDDPTKMKEFRERFMNRPGLEGVNAVNDGRVNMVAFQMVGGPHLLFTTAYFAKWFYPDLFEDLDPEAIHQEYLDRFQGLDYDLDEHGVFAYPPIESDDGLAGIPDKYKELI
ncbi:MAG: ABC transporter substrate-binding protein, partial [Methanophagales archaeon]|nr:ABC transporter substrate-binding protein [Methanophagales archaeon]